MGIFNFFSSHKDIAPKSQKSEAPGQLDLFPNLSQEQKFAMVTMLASLAAAPADTRCRQAMAKHKVLTDATMIGISEETLLNYFWTRSRPNPEAFISTLKTINNDDLEWLIYSCYDIIAVNQNEKACCVFLDWCQQLGYEPEKVVQLVKEVKGGVCDKFLKLCLSCRND